MIHYLDEEVVGWLISFGFLTRSGLGLSHCCRPVYGAGREQMIVVC